MEKKKYIIMTEILKIKVFFDFCSVKVFVFIFEHGKKYFKYSRVRNILTFEVILIIFGCIIRAYDSSYKIL